MTDDRSHSLLPDVVNQLDRERAAHQDEDTRKPEKVRILPDGTVLPDHEPEADTAVSDADMVAPGTVIPDPDAERR